MFPDLIHTTCHSLRTVSVADLKNTFVCVCVCVMYGRKLPTPYNGTLGSFVKYIAKLWGVGVGVARQSVPLRSGTGYQYKHDASQMCIRPKKPQDLSTKISSFVSLDVDVMKELRKYFI